jgi:acyl-ACP thioesterase
VVHNYAAFEDLRGVVRNPVRIDGGKGGPIESEAYRISFKRDIVMAARLSDDLLEERHRTTDAHRLRWKPHLTVGDGEDVDHLGEYPVRFTDVDLFDHMNNAAHWSVVEDYLSTHPEPLRAPLQVTPLEYEAPNPWVTKLEILAHTHLAGSTDRFGAELGAPPLAAHTDRAHAIGLTEVGAGRAAGQRVADDPYRQRPKD